MVKESIDILGKLLGGVARVKIMRLFLLNPVQGFEATDVAERSRINLSITRRMVVQLAGMDFIRKRSFVKETENKRTGKIRKKRASGYFLNVEFPYLGELRQLLVEGDFFKHADLVKRFRPAGAFISWWSRVFLCKTRAIGSISSLWGIIFAVR